MEVITSQFLIIFSYYRLLNEQADYQPEKGEKAEPEKGQVNSKPDAPVFRDIGFNGGLGNRLAKNGQTLPVFT